MQMSLMSSKWGFHCWTFLSQEPLDTLCGCLLVLLLASSFAFCPLCSVSGCTISLLQAENDSGPALAEDGLWLLEQEGKCRDMVAPIIFKACQYL